MYLRHSTVKKDGKVHTYWRLVSVEEVNDDRLYRALDALLPHKTALEQHLKRRLDGHCVAAMGDAHRGMLHPAHQYLRLDSGVSMADVHTIDGGGGGFSDPEI